MIFAERLCKSYKDIRALRDVSLTVKSGEICGILGPNGAGKSTLFKILCKLVTPDSGSFRIESIKKKPLGAIIEKPSLFEYLSAYENLLMLSRIQKAPSDQKTIEMALEEVGLSPERKDCVRNYSMGMKQRLSIAIALLNQPDCLILDEPFLGLDPLGMQSLRQLIQKLAHKDNLTILISSHLLDELSRTCDTLNVISKGEIIQSGTKDHILNLTSNTYVIRGKNLLKSMELKNRAAMIEGDYASLPLTAADAPNLLKSLVDEGIDITYFGSEMNLGQLYQSK